MSESGGGMLLMREAVHLSGQGVCGKFLYLPLNFPVNLKLLLKKKSKKKRNY